jgi:hypothetical protein
MSDKEKKPTKVQKFVSSLTPEQKQNLAVLISDVRAFACSGRMSVQACLNGFLNALDREVRKEEKKDEG